MTTFLAVVDESRRPEHRHFYVPSFAIRIEGSGLPNDVLKDVIELTYHDSLTEIDQFEITVNNWDPAQRVCKYIGSETAADLARADSDELPFKLFEPCRKTVEISFGYADRLLPMMVGHFTTMEPNFPASGPPALSVRGLNALHLLRKKKYSTAWVNRKPSWIARNIATLRDRGQPRFPLPIAVDAEAENAEAEIQYVAQTDQYDVDFLLNLARQHGYEVEIQEANSERRTPRRFWFGPGRRARPPVNYRLDWGRTLVEFKPTLTTANQFKSVTVRGWDRQAQRPINAKVSFDDPELRRMNADLQELIVNCDPREEQVVDLPVFTQSDARRRALGILRDRNAAMVKATATTIGLPELRAGTSVDIQGVGARLSGEYLVTKTTHTIGDSGYTTKFDCRREHFGGQQR